MLIYRSILRMTAYATSWNLTFQPGHYQLKTMIENLSNQGWAARHFSASKNIRWMCWATIPQWRCLKREWSSGDLMEFRNIVISNAAKLSIQNDQLCMQLMCWSAKKAGNGTANGILKKWDGLSFLRSSHFLVLFPDFIMITWEIVRKKCRFFSDDYTTTREKGELQQYEIADINQFHYTTTREKVKRNSPPPTFHEPVHRV